MAAMAEWFGGKIIDKIMDKLFDACFEYLQDLDIWKTGMKEAVERLQKRHPVIQSVVFAYNQAQIGYQNSALDRWLWQLRDAIDEADDLLDDFEYLRACKFRRVGKGAPKIGSNLKKLEEVVQKLDKVSSEFGAFLHLLESTKQEQQKQQLELFKARETGSLPKNDLIGRGQDKEFVRQTCIALSSMESELYALASAGEEAEWIRDLIIDISMTSLKMHSISIFCDNQATKTIATNTLFNGKRRQLRMKQTWLTYLTSQGIISLLDMRSKDNVADVLTKGLCKVLTFKTSGEMGLKSIQ